MEKEEKRKLVWVGIFAIAMAFVETMVVYYLRRLYYPNNILFPLNVSMPTQILLLEWARELSTIIMLLAIAALTGRKLKDKFAYFVYAFAIWDIFYYVWLKVTLDWPSSVMTWDVLFLIPVTWVSPVICPIIVSMSMILGAFVILNYPKNEFTRKQKSMLIIGAILVYTSFVWNYSTLFLKKGFTLKFSEILIEQQIISIASTYVPDYFNWPLFIIGMILALYVIYSFWKKGKK
ncbi:MAG: hypothetical protein PHH54_04545 [Candidatus Nanoarchaeia archaeon]|nr:hypothetical protein [Candidatus Nanoarchaeia archaeon]MDD5741227.1 hypothetical protein [Candidatus Nanoarchaeia archaeon]